jgi:hypothetical protein
MSGEHRLPACHFRHAAENILSVALPDVLLPLKDVAGNVPATTGWQPALSRISSFVIPSCFVIRISSF